MNTARPSSKLPGSGLPILNERSVNNRRAFLPIRRIKESRIVCNHNVNKVDPSDFSSTAMWTGMGRRAVVAWLATVLGTAGSLQIASEAKAIGFKKELKKKKISVEEYSSLGKELLIPVQICLRPFRTRYSRNSNTFKILCRKWIKVL